MGKIKQEEENNYIQRAETTQVSLQGLATH